jgi:hypothetical protein
LYRPLGWPWDYAAIPFGDTFTAYSAALLEQNMKPIHKNFSGVTLVYREE